MRFVLARDVLTLPDGKRVAAGSTLWLADSVAAGMAAAGLVESVPHEPLPAPAAHEPVEPTPAPDPIEPPVAPEPKRPRPKGRAT